MGIKRLTTAQIALIMAVLTVCSKSLGFIRELVLANYYGAGTITDAYVMASQIPGTLLAAVMTAFGTAYMPVLSQKFEKEGKDSANAFTSKMFNVLLITSLMVIVLGICFARPLIGVFAPGFDADTAELTAHFLRISFWLLIGYVFISICEPYLQYKGRMIVSVVLGYINSLTAITVIVISVFTSYRFLIWGVTLGYVIRGIALLISTYRNGYKYNIDFHFDDSVKEVFILAFPVFLGGGISQINTFIDRMIASGLGSGSVSAMNYGNLIVTFIVSMSATVMVTIIFPKLNFAFATNHFERIGNLTESAINLFALFCIPFTLGAMTYASPVIQVIYERGAFAEAATELTASAFFYYAIGISFLALNQLLTKVFYSMHDTKTAVYCSVMSLITNIVLNLILSRIMGVGGLALATSIAQAINSMLLYYMFKHKYPHITLIKGKRKLALIGLFSIIAVAASYAVYHFVCNTVWMPRMVLLGIAVLIAVIIYLILLYVSKFEELSILKDLIKH